MLASLYGTVVVAVVALIVGVPVALTTALFLSEYAPAWSRRSLIALVDLAAAIPSVVYGLWGFFEVQPNVVGISNWMSAHLGFIPFFKIVSPPANASLFIAGLIVGLMIVPIIASVTREVYSLAPPGEREAALALGASRWQMIRTVVLPFGRGGTIGAVMLGMGRALEETIAVSIILGEAFVISPHILQHGGSTIASLIAINFGSGGKLGLEDLLMCGFVLFAAHPRGQSHCFGDRQPESQRCGSGPVTQLLDRPAPSAPQPPTPQRRASPLRPKNFGVGDIGLMAACGAVVVRLRVGRLLPGDPSFRSVRVPHLLVLLVPGAVLVRNFEAHRTAGGH